MEENKFLVSIQKNKKKLSISGIQLFDILDKYNLLDKKFQAKKVGTNIFIDLTPIYIIDKIKIELKKNEIYLKEISGNYFWVSDFNYTKNAEIRKHSFIILNNKQLEFDF